MAEHRCKEETTISQTSVGLSSLQTVKLSTKKGEGRGGGGGGGGDISREGYVDNE